MANSKLQMPANYMALNESEMSCVEGGGIISQVCYAFGRMFRSTYYDKWESESKTLEQSHGAVVSKKNGVYTYSDGYTHTNTKTATYTPVWAAAASSPPTRKVLVKTVSINITAVSTRALSH